MTKSSAAVAWAAWGGEAERGPTDAGFLRHATSVDEIVRFRAQRDPDHLAYLYLENGETEGQSYTYDRLDRRARAIAARLRRHYKPGDRALLIFPPGLDYMATFLGCLYAGIVAVPVYPPDPARLNRSLPRVKIIASDADTRIALTTSAVLPLGQQMSQMDADFATFDWLAVDTIPDAEADDWPGPVTTPESIAFLQYTSGSTSDPKGVMVTHGNLLYNLWDMATSWFKFDGDGRLVTWLPVFHDMGLIAGLLFPVYGKFPCYMMAPRDFVQQPVRWLEAISRYRATHSCAPTFAFDLCSRKVTPAQRANLDLSSWIMAGNGSEPIHWETLERFANTFRGCGLAWKTISTAYGLAEATLVVTSTPPGEAPTYCPVIADELERHRVVEAAEDGPGVRKIVGCGKTNLDTRVLIVDPESCMECAPDSVGEIWVSGPTIAHGYWNRPDVTKQVFQAQLADTGEGPFLRTGDLGFVRGGELFVTGRIKDLIIIDGQNHYPQDVELTVEKAHAAIRPGSVIAFSVEQDSGEKLIVVAEAKGIEGDPAALRAVVSAVRTAVTQTHDVRAHKVCLIQPRTIARTSSGKLQRHACKRDYLNEMLDTVVIG